MPGTVASAIVTALPDLVVKTLAGIIRPLSAASSQRKTTTECFAKGKPGCADPEKAKQSPHPEAGKGVTHHRTRHLDRLPPRHMAEPHCTARPSEQRELENSDKPSWLALLKHSLCLSISGGESWPGRSRIVRQQCVLVRRWLPPTAKSLHRTLYVTSPYCASARLCSMARLSSTNSREGSVGAA